MQHRQLQHYVLWHTDVIGEKRILMFCLVVQYYVCSVIDIKHLIRLYSQIHIYIGSAYLSPDRHTPTLNYRLGHTSSSASHDHWEQLLVEFIFVAVKLKTLLG